MISQWEASLIWYVYVYALGNTTITRISVAVSRISYYVLGIPNFSSLDSIKQRLSFIPPLQILEHYICYPLGQPGRPPADMWRDEDVWGLPQRVTFRQGLRLCDIQGGSAEQSSFKSLDQGGRVDKGASRDVDEEWLLLAEDLELLCADAVSGLGAHGKTEEDNVQVLAKKVVDGFGAGAREPLCGEEAVWVTGAGHDVFSELLGLWSRPGAQGLDVYLHAERVS